MSLPARRMPRSSERGTDTISRYTSITPQAIGGIGLQQLDTTFSDDGVQTVGMQTGSGAIASAVAIQSDGKSVILATIKLERGDSQLFVVRHNSDGTGDIAKDIGLIQGDTPVDEVAASVAIQQDGKIIILGSCVDPEIGDSDTCIWRLNPADFTVDKTFDENGFKILFTTRGETNNNDLAANVAIQSDNKIVILETCVSPDGEDPNLCMWRLNPDGTDDTTFGDNGFRSLDTVFGELINDDVAAGLAIQADGKIVVLETASYAEIEHSDIAIWRLNPDGTDDTTFGDASLKGSVRFLGMTRGDKLLDDVAAGVDIQPDGKIVIFETFSGPKGENYPSGVSIWRLNTDSTTDGVWGIVNNLRDDGTQADDVAASVVVQQDSKIVGVGSTNASGHFDFYLFRLSTNGDLDSTFGDGGKVILAPDAGGAFEDRAVDVAIQSDGKAVFVGNSNRGDNNSEIVIARTKP